MRDKFVLYDYKLEELITFKKKDIAFSEMYPKNFNEGDILFPYDSLKEEYEYIDYLKNKGEVYNDYGNVPGLVFIKKQDGKFCWIGEGQYGQEASLHWRDADDMETREIGDVKYSRWALIEFTEKGEELLAL